MTLYAKYRTSGKHADPAMLPEHVVTVYHTQQGFFCESAVFGTSPIYDVSDSRDAVHKFIRDKGYYLVRVKELDLV